MAVVRGKSKPINHCSFFLSVFIPYSLKITVYSTMVIYELVCEISNFLKMEFSEYGLFSLTIKKAHRDCIVETLRKSD